MIVIFLIKIMFKVKFQGVESFENHVILSFLFFCALYYYQSASIKNFNILASSNFYNTYQTLDITKGIKKNVQFFKDTITHPKHTNTRYDKPRTDKH